MLHCQFLSHVLKALFFIKIALKLSYFCKKMHNLQALGCRPQTPVPLTTGGFSLGRDLPYGTMPMVGLYFWSTLMFGKKM